MEKVKAHGWWESSIAKGALVVCITVVAIAQSSGDVATNDVVQVITQIRIEPGTEEGIGQTEGGLIQNAIIIEGHVVDLVICTEGKGLRTDLKPKRAGLRLGMHISTIVIYPPDRLVPIDQIHFFLRAVEGLVQIVCRIIHGGIVNKVAIAIDKRRQDIGQFAFYTITWPFLNAQWDAVSREILGFITARIVFTFKPCSVDFYLLAIHEPVSVVLVADRLIDRCRPIAGQWPCPIVVTAASVGHCRQLQLVSLVHTAEPKSTSEHGVASSAFGHLVACLVQIPPHIATGQNGRTDIVDAQIALSSSRCTQFFHHLERRITLAAFPFVGRLLRLQRGSEGEEDQTVCKYILHCGCLVFQMIRSSAAFQGVSVWAN